MSVSNAPRSVAAHLAIKDASSAIEFYVSVFGADEDFRLVDPLDGRIGHAELSFGNTKLFLCDEYPDFGAVSPDTLGGSPVQFHVEVADADAFVAAAAERGAVVLRPVTEQFYGYRSGLLADPFGYRWFVDSKVEELTADEMQQRWSASVST